MRYSKTFTAIAVLVALGVLLPGNASMAQDDPFAETTQLETSLEEEMQWLQAETFVITASRILENIRKSASSITVITSNQIRNTGARHLADALRMVPGLGVMINPENVYKFEARGILKGTGQHVLLMINSHPLNENFLGGALTLYDTTLLDNVERIEVIRGPGSALYGANAFAGVINIITKSAEDLNGIQFTTRGGSFRTQEYNVLAGKHWEEFALDANLNYFDSKGAEFFIEQDAVTIIDQTAAQYGIPPASLAPMTVSPDDQKYDAALRLDYKGFSLEGRYIQRERENVISPIGALAKPDQNIEEMTTYNLMVKYENELRDTLVVSGKLYRNHYDMQSQYQGFPPGMLIATPAGPTILGREGLRAKTGRQENRTGAEAVLTYSLGETHTLVGGGNYESMEMYDVSYSANFRYTPVQNVIVLLPAVQDLSNPATSYAKEADRTFQALFIEDLWDLRDDMRLTIGARYDNYSDFGSSFNPRAGLTWEFSGGYDLKIMYGRAFRAPSFIELYSQNNPAVVGNPDLEPETVNTYEISLGADLTESAQVRLTGFRNDIKESINTLLLSDGRTEYQNKDELRSQGAELEVQYDFGKGIYLTANYTFQDAINLETDEPYEFVPQHKGNVVFNMRLSKYVNLSTDLYMQGKYRRVDDDPRDDIDGFAVLNATVIAKNFLDRFEVRGSVYNLLDSDYSVPYPSLPQDFPQPGRSFLVELRYSL